MTTKRSLRHRVIESQDCKARRQLINFLRDSEETLLIASHDLEFLLETCERTVMLDDGQICADGQSRTIMSDELLMNSHGFEKPHSLVPHAELEATALQWASEVCGKSPTAQRMAKFAFNRVFIPYGFWSEIERFSSKWIRDWHCSRSQCRSCSMH